MKNMKRQSPGLENILATIDFDKDLTARIHFKKILHINIGKITTKTKNR